MLLVERQKLLYNFRGVVKMMPDAAEVIERLARALEQERILAKMNECKTLEDFEKVREELKIQTEKRHM